LQETAVPLTLTRQKLTRHAQERQTLDLVMPNQGQDEWCWAAVAAGINNLLSPAQQLNPCDVASSVLGQVCCQDKPCKECLTDYYLEVALDDLKHLNGDPTQGALPFQDLMTDIKNSHPVGVRIEWSGGSGHFVAIDGYGLDDTGQQMVDVQDPANGHWYHPYDLFCTNYLGGGKWSFTYRTE
jgi:hypothetical protein